MDIMDYIKPGLIVVAIILYFIGIWLKQSTLLPDKFIPLVVGFIGIVICGIWVVATSTFITVQGILVAGLSTYVNQIIKQINKQE